ncbi:TRAP transporter substrate-binding protein [Maritimibacter alkaliphilus]|uniref:TRAP transporter substrate-binding protein n=1 Tax=Maritimibacter alkaliphilus TaxID=404236 RepID=UPI001C954325|nr:TRAP transporter substrate-binding protein [Maritimibacter alkaliphilus]MBY6092642.1 TRAP transporter substrate-binding protein [Maritimibacter alkaliphilus]
MAIKTLSKLKMSLLGAVIAMPASAADLGIALDTAPDLENSGSYVWAHTFAEHLNAIEGWTVKELARGAVGGEAEKLDQIQQGLLEVAMADLKSAGSLNAFAFGLGLPYFWESIDELDAALTDGGIMARINEGTQPHGVRVAAIAPIGDFSGIFNTKHAVSSVSEMADLRMRALDQRQVDLFTALGVSSTIVSWDEVPNALQTGIADGYVNSAMVPVMFGHTGFIKHFTDAKAWFSTRIAIISDAWHQGLSEEDQAHVEDATAAANQAHRAWLGERRAADREGLKAAGIEFTELSPEARAEFQELAASTYAETLGEDALAAYIAARNAYQN